MMMMIISSWWWGGGGDEISPKFHNLAYHTYWIEHWCSDKPLSEQQVLIRIYIFAWPYHVSIFCSEEFSLKCPFFFTCLLDLSVHCSTSERSQLLSHGMPGWLMNPIEVAHCEGKNPMLKIGKAKERKSGGVTPVNAQLFGSLLQLCPARAQTDLYCQKFPTFPHRFLVGVSINVESYRAVKGKVNVCKTLVRWIYVDVGRPRYT